MGDHLETDQDEISAVGELWKQSQTGGKLWSLRKFVLTNVYLIYYNQKGEKRGQWDITDCIVRPLTPQEAGSKSAYNAFAVIGARKFFLFNANNQANRAAWISVIEDQIEEFKDPDRRYLRTGEALYGKGDVKKKNMLGMGVASRLLITNYPRLIVVDPIAKVRKMHLSWGRDNPPTFVKLSDSKFKVMTGTNESMKELFFEDPEKGSRYWEDIFRKFPKMEYFVPKRRNTLTINFNEANKFPLPEGYKTANGDIPADDVDRYTEVGAVRFHIFFD